MIIALWWGAISSDAQSFVYDCMFIICKFSKILFNIKGYSIKKPKLLISIMQISYNGKNMLQNKN